MFALSLNYKSADLLLREKFCFDDEKASLLLSILKNNNIKECVYLSTCNRCELYGVGDMYKALKIFSNFADIGYEKVKDNILFYENEGAVAHLFSVCSGFDSMVLGEDEILGQVKKAFEFSQKKGFTDYELNTIFKAAVTSAKRIKTQTLISKSSVSVATLAASKCHMFSKKVKTVLIVGGSGDIGSKVIKNLISYNDFKIYAAARNYHHLSKDVTIIPYEKRYDYVNEADIIISATKSPHYIFTFDGVRNSIKNNKARLFIDLAVPRDIDRDVENVSGAELICIDDFKLLADKNRQIKSKELKTAEDIMREDIDTLLKDIAFHRLLPRIQKADNEIKHFIYNFRDTATAKEFESFMSVFTKMEGKV